MSLRLSNRRKRPDLLLQLLTWFNAAAVISLAAALCVAAIAKPELETFFDRYYNLQLRQTWNQDLIGYLGLLLGLSCIASIVGLAINSKRLRRKSDHIHVTLILSLIVSLIALGLYLKVFLIQA
ncbi:MAG: hypothetical protein OQK50_07935 [Deltaproteobacteria bacterium]|jgi:hypothetical protein|nr:hypothetical protein [Deltaproteobacteria bacterium]MCW9050244.1 hypothetical protein [Deltaproteobacteria bacterium]